MNTSIFININYQNSKYVYLADTIYTISHLPKSKNIRIMLIHNKTTITKKRRNYETDRFENFGFEIVA